VKAFAENTSVSVERSKAELDTLLGKAGAASRGIVSDDQQGQAIVAFALGGGKYRLSVPLPKLEDFPQHKQWPQGWAGWSDGRRSAWRYKQWEQASRQRWRALILVVKSKLEIVRLGLSSAQREFMADLVLSNGQTVSEMMATPGNRLLSQSTEGP
jgi:hypothetical protein